MVALPFLIQKVFLNRAPNKIFLVSLGKQSFALQIDNDPLHLQLRLGMMIQHFRAP